MADEAGDKPQRSGFWTTMPGVLTAVAALITAVATLVGVLFAVGVFHGSAGTASDRPASGTLDRDGGGASPTPSWTGVRKQGQLVVYNGEIASVDSGAAPVTSGDFQLFVDKDTGDAYISTIFNNVYFSSVTGTPDAQACASTLASLKRESVDLTSQIGKWICVSTIGGHVGAIQPVKIVAEQKQVTFNYVLWKDAA